MRLVRLHLIGGFELTIDDDDVLTVQPAMQRLLAFVALMPRGVDRLCAALQLWPDSSEERANANLRSTLWRIRKLPVHVVAGTTTRLRLADHVWVDVRDGLDELATGVDGGLLRSPLPFQSLMADLLPDWYDDWVGIERERLRQLTLRSLEARARAALDVGDVAEAIQAALSAVSVDPLRESAHRLLICAHLAEGNGRDAVLALERYRSRLAQETGLAVSTGLEALVDPLVAAV